MENVGLTDGSVLVRIPAEEVRDMTRNGSRICVVTSRQLEALAMASAKRALQESEREKESEEWLTQKQAASVIKRSSQTFSKIVKEGKIRFSQVKGRRVFKRSDLEEYMSRQTPLYVRNIGQEGA